MDRITEQTEKRLQEVMQRAVDDHKVMGVNLLVYREGENELYLQAGMADREAKRQMTRDTIFRLYSQTKPITSAAVMILMERGIVDLFQPVSDFLPEYAHVRVNDGSGDTAPARPVLIWNLLRMTSGLVYGDELTPAGIATQRLYDEMQGVLHTEHAFTTREFAARLAEGPLAFSPGSSWSYGTSADVLGAVIEVADGRRFGQFLEEEIFAPLGMTDTAFYVPADKRDRLAAAYTPVPGENGNLPMQRYEGEYLAVTNPPFESPAYEAGGAGLVSTLDDYLRFARMLMEGGKSGGAVILQPGTVRFMTGASLQPLQQQAFRNWLGLDGFSYGNLMRRCVDPSMAGMRACGDEYGWDGWLGMYFANFPQERMTILMGTQVTDAGTFDLTRKLRNVLLANCVCI